jgi:hypothetical protein
MIWPALLRNPLKTFGDARCGEKRGAPGILLPHAIRPAKQRRLRSDFLLSSFFSPQ